MLKGENDSDGTGDDFDIEIVDTEVGVHDSVIHTYGK